MKDKDRKCPNCGRKGKPKKYKEVNLSGKWITAETFYECPVCGWSWA